jgi:excisionase family DNA binding protein
MTPSQVARMLNVSADTVRAWADSGRLDCIRTSAGHRLFKRDEVEAFARELTKAASPERSPNESPVE